MIAPVNDSTFMSHRSALARTLAANAETTMIALNSDKRETMNDIRSVAHAQLVTLGRSDVADLTVAEYMRYLLLPIFEKHGFADQFAESEIGKFLASNNQSLKESAFNSAYGQLLFSSETWETLRDILEINNSLKEDWSAGDTKTGPGSSRNRNLCDAIAKHLEPIQEVVRSRQSHGELALWNLAQHHKADMKLECRLDQILDIEEGIVNAAANYAGYLKDDSNVASRNGVAAQHLHDTIKAADELLHPPFILKRGLKRLLATDTVQDKLGWLIRNAEPELPPVAPAMHLPTQASAIELLGRVAERTLAYNPPTHQVG